MIEFITFFLSLDLKKVETKKVTNDDDLSKK
jgi:hypothetical protein